MTDLRTRIAAALMRDAFGLTTQSAALRQADAVIRELGLRRERLGEDTGYPHPQTRYVTNWIADE